MEDTMADKRRTVIIGGVGTYLGAAEDSDVNLFI